jgi:dTDP-4-amino-4,6-dideoxygalactose transaminase
MITTDNEDVYHLLKSYCNHGYDPNKKPYQYLHKTLGLNFRMTDVHAALGIKQLERLDQYVKHRQSIANVYDESLNFLEKQEYDKDLYENNYFLYGVLVDPNKRDSIVEKMLESGIVTKTWSSIASQECYQRKDPPNSKRISDSIILLPIHNQLTIAEAETVAYNLKKIL